MTKPKRKNPKPTRSSFSLINGLHEEIAFLESMLEEAIHANQVWAGAELARHQFYKESTARTYAKAALTGLLSGYAARKDTANLTANEIAAQAWEIAQAMKDHEN